MSGDEIVTELRRQAKRGTLDELSFDVACEIEGEPFVRDQLVNALVAETLERRNAEVWAAVKVFGGEAAVVVLEKIRLEPA